MEPAAHWECDLLQRTFYRPEFEPHVFACRDLSCPGRCYGGRL